MKNKNINKIISIIFAFIIVISAIPVTTLAAPASDIPKQVLDNVYLDALAYTGYKVETQKDDGTIFKVYSNAAPASVRSGIGYGTGPSGLETNSSGKPDIAKFKEQGLCCASYVSYVYFNYLPNVAKINTSSIERPENPRSAVSYNEVANSWVKNGKAKRISFTQSGSAFTPSENIPIGSLIVFKNISSGAIAHVAIYAGYYDGQHFVTHVGSDNGPELCTIVGMTKGDSPEAVVQIVSPQLVEADGIIKIYKKDNKGRNLSGARFVATNTDTKTDYLIGPTDKNGYATTKEGLPYGKYTVKETVFPDNYTYADKKEWNVTVNAESQEVVLNIVNVEKTGNAKVIKKSEDGKVAAVAFKLSGTSVFGDSISLTAKTNTDGIAMFENVPVGNDYVISETGASQNYVATKSQKVSVSYNQTAEVTFKNILKKFNVTVTKKDSETGSVQGNASLSGAKYGLYKGGVLKATYETDESGKFTTDYFPCGTDYTIKEITPSKGYLLDNTQYPLSANAESFTAEKNNILLDVKESVIKGSVYIIKHSDDGKTQIETPEENAEFRIYLKSSGSFSNAKENERDTLITDKDGFAKSKMLPFGEYTVHQEKGKEGREYIKDFEVLISENNQTKKFLINNAVFSANVILVKTDAETGKTIPASGVGFKIKNRLNGEYITQHINYPTPEDITVFYTANNGMLMLPSALSFGDYELYEVKSANGYTLNSNAILFSVDGTHNDITVSMPNTPQKGKLLIEKRGEVFASVKENNGIFTPVYEEKGLEGAEFNIIAAKDIVTPDGTVRMKKGTVADTVITDRNGKAESKELYLGEYSLIETKAPYGMVIDSEPQNVSLDYSDETVKVNIKTVTLTDKRKKASIKIKKKLETDSKFGIGIKDEILNVTFGLFAAEDLIAADGKIIPKDGILDVAAADSDGNVCFKADVPFTAKLYVKEIETDEHYVISNDVYNISFDNAKDSDEYTEININDKSSIENQILRGTITGHKTDEKGNALSGAVFGLFSTDEKDFCKENAFLIAKSDKNGIFSFKNIPFGNYIVREIAGVKGYVLSDDDYFVSINKNLQNLQITVVNKKICGGVMVEKRSSYDNSILISGAEFLIYKDVNKDGKFTKGVDVFVTKLTESEQGIYTAEDLPIGKYLLYESKAPKGYVKDLGYYSFEIKNENECVKVENTKGKGFLNIPINPSPKTGDSVQIRLLTLIIAISFLGTLISATQIFKKKRGLNSEKI